jgi:hypothetical protein
MKHSDGQNDKPLEEAILLTLADDETPPEKRARIPWWLRRHYEVMFFVTIAMIGSFSMHVDHADTGEVMALGRFHTPSMCASKTVWGVTCPGCGLSRSFVCMAHADFRVAYDFNRVGPLMFVVAVFQYPYRFIGLRRRRRWPFGRLWGRIWANLLIGCLIGNWLWNVGCGEIF